MEIINLILLAIFGIFALVGLITGLAKGVWKALLKLATTAVSAVVAYLMAPLLLQKAYDLASPMLENLMVQFADVIAVSPTLESYIPTLGMALVSPLVFISVFLVCQVVMAIVRAIFGAVLTGIFGKEVGGVSRLLGLVAGTVSGLIIALCIVFPVTGYFTVVPSLYANVKDSDIIQEEIPSDVEQIIVELPNQPAIKTVNDVTSGIFSNLVSYDVEGKKVNALSDLQRLTSLLSPAMSFVNGISEIETMDIQPVRDMANIIGESVTLRAIVAEVVTEASTKWLAGEAFLGIDLKGTLPTDYQNALDGILLKMSNSTKDNIVQNLNELADTVESLQHVYIYVQMLDRDTHTIEELEQQLINVLTSVDDHTVELVHDLVTADLLSSMNIPNADFISQVIKDVVENCVQNGDDHQITQDATAINNIMHFVMDSESVSAEQVLQSIEQSPTIVQSFEDIVNSGNIPQITLNAQAKQQIAEALSTVEDTNLVDSIKVLFGIE